MNTGSKTMEYAACIYPNSTKREIQSLTIHTDSIQSANILCLIHSEFVRAKTLHPVWPTNRSEMLTIITEEIGEIAKAINENDDENLTEEIIQSAAVCLRMLMELGVGVYEKS